MPTSYVVNITLECSVMVVIASLIGITFNQMHGRKPVHSERIMLNIMITNIVGLMFDVASYFVDGGMTTFYIVANRVCILMSFLYGPVLIYLFSYYIIILIREGGGPSGRGILWFFRWIALINFVLLGITQLRLDAGEYSIYYFDSQNIYHRGQFFVINYAVPTIMFLVIIGWLIMNKKSLTHIIYSTLVAACIASVSGIVIQTLTDGIAFAHVGNAAAIAIFFVGYYKQREEYYLEDREQMLKIRNTLLLSQIQPHFIFNALNTIQALVKKDPDRACDAIDDFSDFLRGSMDAMESDELIPIRSELKTTLGYLEIERLRFGKSLEVETDIEYTDFHVPPFTVQPIVENAVRHGIREGHGEGTVRIATRETDGGAVIEISDDGKGFNPDTVGADGEVHIGIKNVRERLEHMPGAEMKIESKEGEGTRVIMTIPKVNKS